ncbi:hypothetical protein ORL36_16385 [Klebsiella pasteurii]|uniref:hypothetical protein n=1 Tax=Klebsiella pasteurii TaxID=2587529 RepID=UPI0022476DCB|nr:hypothetical protein [Klebsiella pasteurii]MCW9586194.1 hypothetical protein [Klebsiella pasteurii]
MIVTHSGDINVSLNPRVLLMTTEERQNFVELVIGICGSGKSYGYSKYINNSPSARFIVSAKTDVLCAQIAAGLPGAVVINTDSLNMRKLRAKDSVTSQFSNAVKSYQHRVIIVTHKALELLSTHLHYDDDLRLALIDYQMIIDEAPDSRKQVSARLEKEVIHVYPWLSYTVTQDGRMYSNRPDKLREYLKGLVD